MSSQEVTIRGGLLGIHDLPVPERVDLGELPVTAETISRLKTSNESAWLPLSSFGQMFEIFEELSELDGDSYFLSDVFRYPAGGEFQPLFYVNDIGDWAVPARLGDQVFYVTQPTADQSLPYLVTQLPYAYSWSSSPHSGSMEFEGGSSYALIAERLVAHETFGDYEAEIQFEVIPESRVAPGCLLSKEILKSLHDHISRHGKLLAIAIELLYRKGQLQGLEGTSIGESCNSSLRSHSFGLERADLEYLAALKKPNPEIEMLFQIATNVDQSPYLGFVSGALELHENLSEAFGDLVEFKRDGGPVKKGLEAQRNWVAKLFKTIETISGQFPSGYKVLNLISDPKINIEDELDRLKAEGFTKIYKAIAADISPQSDYSSRISAFMKAIGEVEERLNRYRFATTQPAQIALEDWEFCHCGIETCDCMDGACDCGS